MSDTKKDISIFDFLKSITYTKKDLTKDDRFEKSYNKFMINRFLSNSPKTIFLAQFIAKYPDIHNNLHFKFFQIMIDKENIFFKYHKKKNIHSKELVNRIKECYDVNETNALEYIKLLKAEQIDHIMKSYGGRK